MYMNPVLWEIIRDMIWKEASLVLIGRLMGVRRVGGVDLLIEKDGMVFMDVQGTKRTEKKDEGRRSA